jgi:hypothetical protein
MKKEVMKIIVLIGLFALTFGSLPAWAQDESPVSASADVSFFSQYIWRGYALSDSDVVIQPSATVSYKGVSFNLWGNLDTKDPFTNDSSFNETDMTLSYSRSFDKVSVGAGYIYYALEGEDTQEFFVSLGVDTILSPTLTIYRDIDTFPGWYFNLGVSHSIAFTDELALDLAASVGYYDIGDYSEFHDGSVSASMTFPVDKYISITPKLAYSFGLTNESRDDIKAASWDSKSDHFWGGITCSVAF